MFAGSSEGGAPRLTSTLSALFFFLSPGNDSNIDLIISSVLRRLWTFPSLGLRSFFQSTTQTACTSSFDSYHSYPVSFVSVFCLFSTSPLSAREFNAVNPPERIKNRSSRCCIFFKIIIVFGQHLPGGNTAHLGTKTDKRIFVLPAGLPYRFPGP